MKPISEVNSKKIHGWWWKITIAVLLIFMAGMAVVIFKIDRIAYSLANYSLNRYLTGGGQLKAVDISLKSGRIQLDGLKINAPKGFGPDPLLSLNNLTLDVAPTSLFMGEIVADEVTVDGLALIVERNQKGEFSVTKLLSQQAPTTEPEPRQSGGDNAASSIPAIRVNAIRLKNLSLRMIDRMVGKQWLARLQLDLSVDGLKLDDVLKLKIQAGAMHVAIHEIHVDQPDGFSQAPLLTVDKLELDSPGFDLGASRVQIRKILLDHLKASMERDAKGAYNLQRLLAAWIPNPDETDSSARQPEVSSTAVSSGSAESAESFTLPALMFEEIQLKAIALQLLAHTEAKPWRAGFKGLDVTVAGLALGDLAKRALALNHFNLGLKEVKIDQPSGYDAEKPIRLQRLTVTAEKMDLAAQEMVVQQVLVEGLVASVIEDKQGGSNLKKIKSILAGKAEPSSEKQPPPATKEAEPASAEKMPPAAQTPLPVIRFNKIQMKDGAFEYRNAALTKTPLIFPLDQIELVVSRLCLFDDNPKAEPASAALSFELAQPKNLPKAYFGAVAAIGPLGKGVPLNNAQARLTGLKLDTLGSLVPPATRTSIGATGLDADLSLALNPKGIKLDASVLTDHHIRYDALHVSGPLQDPHIEVGAILAGVFNRVSSGLLNLSKHTVGAGIDVAKGGVNAAKKVGSGAWGLTKNLGKSIFKVGAGLVTIDKDKVAEGLVDSTVGTVEITAGTVKDTGVAAGSGVKGSVTDLTGDKMVKAWDAAIPQRYQQEMAQARKALEAMPYPPVTKKDSSD